MSGIAAPRALSAAEKRALKILLIAKHVHAESDHHPTDGTHAAYHREMRRTLEEIGVDLRLADTYDVLNAPVEADFVFPLLNRSGFLNSEMLLPLLCERAGLPYLGANPILRGLADDKHLSKRVAVAYNVPTAAWAIFRRGAPLSRGLCPEAKRYVVKPNASSASWGISAAWDWEQVKAAVTQLHMQGHDAIVEPFIGGHDIEISVITLDGEPLILPTQIVEQDDPATLRTYAEKRNLAAEQGYAIRPMAEGPSRRAAEIYARAIMREFLPFDYGRFEFRMDAETGAVSFMEVNLNCNLWSRKTISIAAQQYGWTHAELIETILTESLKRQGVLRPELTLAA